MFEKKTVFVSGGTGHIGSEICCLCNEYGAKVVFSYRDNKDKANELTKRMKNSKAIQINFENINDMQKKIEKLYKEVGVIDVLVNNASISEIMPLSMLEEDDVDLIFDTNLKGTIFLTKYIVKGMIKNKSGVIINIGSIAGHRLLDVPVTYAVSKAAISGLTYSLTTELKRFGIRVNSVIPGLIDGGVSKGIPEDLRKEFISHCVVGRAGKAREVAEVVCFLASDRASYVNGQNIFVDGGI